MKTKILIMQLSLFTSCIIAQNINYQSWVTKFEAYDSSCSSEVGNEEYTWYGYANDNAYTTETSTGCKEKTANGYASISGSFGLRTRNNTTASHITGRVRAWEDDSGSRCSYDTGSLINNDDCSTNVAYTYALSNPLEYEFTTTTKEIGSGSFSMDFRYTYRYSVELLDAAVENTTETFISSGDRPFWGAKGSWASDDVDCAASGTIGNNQNSILRTTVSDMSSVTFKWRVSSATEDFLQVYVNDVLDEQISGNVNWITKTIEFTETINTIEWRYQKNASGIGGLDRGFVDNISFEEGALNTNTEALNYISIYPNPVKSILNIKGLNNEIINLDIYNILGKKVKVIKNILNRIDLSSLNNGYYIIKLYTSSSYKTFKILKK